MAESVGGEDWLRQHRPRDGQGTASGGGRQRAIFHRLGLQGMFSRAAGFLLSSLELRATIQCFRIYLPSPEALERSFAS